MLLGLCVSFGLILFQVKKTAAETYRLYEAFNENASSQAKTFDWFKCTKDDRKSAKDYEFGSKLNVRKIRKD